MQGTTKMCVCVCQEMTNAMKGGLLVSVHNAVIAWITACLLLLVAVWIRQSSLSRQSVRIVAFVS